jgi:hypothetical protein
MSRVDATGSTITSSGILTGAAYACFAEAPPGNPAAVAGAAAGGARLVVRRLPVAFLGGVGCDIRFGWRLEREGVCRMLHGVIMAGGSGTRFLAGQPASIAPSNF